MQKLLNMQKMPIVRFGAHDTHDVLALQVRNMTKEYTTRSGQPFLAANGVSLDVPANSITALLGPSGSGRLRTAISDLYIYMHSTASRHRLQLLSSA